MRGGGGGGRGGGGGGGARGGRGEQGGQGRGEGYGDQGQAGHADQAAARAVGEQPGRRERAQRGRDVLRGRLQRHVARALVGGARHPRRQRAHADVPDRHPHHEA